MSSHRDTAKRSAADADVDDVMEAESVTIDSQKERNKELHTAFVARYLRNLPRSGRRVTCGPVGWGWVCVVRLHDERNSMEPPGTGGRAP